MDAPPPPSPPPPARGVVGGAGCQAAPRSGGSGRHVGRPPAAAVAAPLADARRPPAVAAPVHHETRGVVVLVARRFPAPPPSAVEVPPTPPTKVVIYRSVRLSVPFIGWCTNLPISHRYLGIYKFTVNSKLPRSSIAAPHHPQPNCTLSTRQKLTHGPCLIAGRRTLSRSAGCATSIWALTSPAFVRQDGLPQSCDDARAAQGAFYKLDTLAIAPHAALTCPPTSISGRAVTSLR